jgi:putative protease
MAEKEIGKVIHWYDKISVAVIRLTAGLKSGDTIKIAKGDEEFEETVDSMQINHEEVAAAKKGDEVAIKLKERAKDGATVLKI